MVEEQNVVLTFSHKHIKKKLHVEQLAQNIYRILAEEFKPRERGRNRPKNGLKEKEKRERESKRDRREKKKKKKLGQKQQC